MHIGEAGQLTWREDAWITLSAALVRSSSHLCIYRDTQATTQIVHLVFKRWEPIKLRVVVPLLVFVPGLLSVLYMQHFGALKGTILAFSAYYGVLCSSIVLYRLSPWHPMARYPGPMLAKFSKFYMVYIVHQPQSWKWIQAQHHKYGDAVRIGAF